MSIIDFETIPSVSQVTVNGDGFDYYTKADLQALEADKAMFNRLIGYAAECLKKGSRAGRKSCINWEASDGVTLSDHIKGYSENALWAFTRRASKKVNTTIPEEIKKVEADLKRQADIAKTEGEADVLAGEADVLATEAAGGTAKNIFIYIIMAAIALVVIIILIRALR